MCLCFRFMLTHTLLLCRLWENKASVPCDIFLYLTNCFAPFQVRTSKGKQRKIDDDSSGHLSGYFETLHHLMTLRLMMQYGHITPVVQLESVRELLSCTAALQYSVARYFASSRMLTCVLVTLSVVLRSSDAAACAGEEPKNVTVRPDETIVVTDITNIGNQSVADADVSIGLLSETGLLKLGTCDVFNNKSNHCQCLLENIKNLTNACTIRVSKLYRLADTGPRYVNTTIVLGKAKEGIYCLKFELNLQSETLAEIFTKYNISYGVTTAQNPTSGAGRLALYIGRLLTCWAFLALCRSLIPIW